MFMKDEDLEVPKRTNADFAHAGASMLVSGASAAASILTGSPIVGASEMFSFLFASPFEKRREQWMESVTEIVREIQNKRLIALESLRDNEEFQTLFMQASQIAIRTHLKEKRELLLGSLVDFIEQKHVFNVTSSYLTIIEQLQPEHIQVLLKLESVESATIFSNKNAFYAFVSEAFVPSVEQPFLEGLVSGLAQYGLAINSQVDESTDGALLYTPYYHYMLSSFGRKFLEYIRSISASG
jgi:hypothetical protein